ncbi:hypothetical protein SLS64_009797 [Diaporthe eres]
MNGSRNSPWRYGGPNGNVTNGPDALDPGGTIEEVEEGGTAPAQAAQTLPATAVLPVAAAATTDPYDLQQPHTHYHINDDNGRRRRRGHGHSRSRGRHHGRRWRRDDDNDGDGILRLVDRERRRDSERQMADADASHRREAMMMGLMERERGRERDRGSSAGLDARDILGVLLDGKAERRRRERRREDTAGESSSGGSSGDGWRGALDALSRRVDEMVLLGRGGYSTGGERGRGSREEPRKTSTAPSARKRAPRVKFTNDRNGSGSGTRPSGGKKKGVSAGGKIIFGRGRDGKQEADGDTDSDTDETSAPSSVAGGVAVKTRGRSRRRAGSPSTSVD